MEKLAHSFLIIFPTIRMVFSLSSREQFLKLLSVLFVASFIALSMIEAASAAQTAQVNATTQSSNTTIVIGGSGNVSSITQKCKKKKNCNQNADNDQDAGTLISVGSTSKSINRIRIRQKNN